ncbi:major facilitator superfamily protein [Entamoeba histolytica HM-1:IMSS-B]|uniref:Major facilitator superfamily protein n=6 Tax=Entamoeba histolytica TaxID=5759 RepID=B1N4W6_ENTH1|nr:major facilitator superfamily transporter [Entamoeba histolytica HM-1:IMSS]EMD44512.1 major facilitator superfamily transporter, putative [Entamoeba histolytica KU27]EMH77337.1 major facilitator superfamily protein [Entamoeba histolytica HM-1:IMSS-B]EMS12591.1 major facilitator superfamily transporter, putative [Entamoeba histolytica HM-3:IMSS]ENY65906.1 major facilitator superfamily transporter, putative [Entamoeba histolytica HM-1:IMSS-A]GAT98966.1 major facilitator superfamily protein [E|eukprot:XP_001914232.1 major facilitator superfamily transporter [Entamoeba histolytica HM-1:IMSS]
MSATQKIKSFIQFLNIPNYFIGGFTINMATYFCWLIIPLLMKENGASSFLIGLADAVTFGICGLLCPIIGLFLNKKWFPIADICRIGFVLQAISGICIALYYIKGTLLLPIFFILILQSFALAFFWSICEFMLSEEAYKGEVNKVISRFACSWSLGKAIGFCVSGPMKTAFGNTFSLYFSSFISLISFVLFPRMPRNRSDITRSEAKALRKKEKNVKGHESVSDISVDIEELNNSKSVSSDESEEQPKSSNETNEIKNVTKEEKNEKNNSSEKKKQPKPTYTPYYFMMYYFNNLVIHFTVYGTIAVFGNQYIDFVDENNIVLNGVNDDPATFASVFLGIIYFSQTITFFVLGLFHHWQYVLSLNIIVQIIIAGVSVGMVFIRNGWVLCAFAVVIGIISGYELQSIVVYSVSSPPKNKGKILGLTECVGELTCSLCPLFAGLLATAMDDRRYALYQGIVLQVVGIVLCITLMAVTKILEIRRKKRVGEDIGIEMLEEGQENSEDQKEKTSSELFEGSPKTKPTQVESDQKSDVEVPMVIVKKEEESESSTLSSSSNNSEDD